MDLNLHPKRLLSNCKSPSLHDREILLFSVYQIGYQLGKILREIKRCIIKIIVTTEPLPQEFLKQVANNNNRFQLFNDGGPYHVETSLLICEASRFTGFCMIGTSVIKELNKHKDVKIVKNDETNLFQ